MRLNKLITFGAAVLVSTNALAVTVSSEYVKSVGLSFPGQAAVINIENNAANKHINSLNLKVKEQKMDFTLSGSITCRKGNKIKYSGNVAYFGPIALGGFGQVVTSATLHSENNIDAAVHKEGSNEIVEYAEDVFSVPLNKVKNGHPTVKVDPIAELNKKLQAHIQGGGTKLSFYQQDQQIVLQRPISLAGYCHKNGDAKPGYASGNHTIQIKYKGDPQLNDKAVINAAIGQQMGNIQVNPNLPFKLNSAEFQPNLPHHIGKCIPDQNPKIRMNFTVSGGKKGVIDLKVEAVSNQYAAYGNYFETAGMVRDPKNGNSHLDFSFPLKEMLSQDKYSYMTQPNKTYYHNMRIKARYRDFDSNNWTEYKDFGTAVYRHRCTPQLNPSLGNGQQQMKDYQEQGGDDGKRGGIKRAPMEPVKPMQIQQMTPVTPKPMGIRATEPEPEKPARLQSR